MPKRSIVWICLIAAASANAQQSPSTSQPAREGSGNVTTAPADPALQSFLEQVNRRSRLTRQGVIVPETREQFVQIEQIARLPEAERITMLPRLYRELMTPTLMHQFIENGLKSLPGNLLLRERSNVNSNNDLTGIYQAQLDQAAATMTPGQVADQIATAYSAAIVEIASRRRAMGILAKHPEATKKLLREDMAKDDPEAIKHAVTIASAMGWKDFQPQITNILIAGGPLASHASQALSAMRSGPEDARPMLDDLTKNPGSIRRYMSLLQSMLAGAQPDPVLLGLLESPDAEIRFYTAQAMERTDEFSALDLVPRLMADGDERVRVVGINIAFRLPENSFATVRHLVIGALRSQGVRERTTAAYRLGMKRDPAGARILLQGAKDSNLPADLRSYVSSAIKQLMNVGPDPFWLLPNSWGPGNAQNAGIIARFEQWIAVNVKD